MENIEKSKKKKVIESPELLKDSKNPNIFDLASNFVTDNINSIVNDFSKMSTYKDIIFRKDISFHRYAVVVGATSVYLLDFNGQSSVLHGTNEAIHLCKGPGIHMTTRSYSFTKKGGTEPKDTTHSYILPKKGYYTIIYSLNALAFNDKEDQDLFIEMAQNMKIDPYSIIVSHLLGFYNSFPFCGCGIINLNENDYYAVLNNQKIKIPKVDIDEFKQRFPTVDFESVHEENDIFAMPVVSSQANKPLLCRIYDLENSIATQKINIRIVSCKKVFRTSTKPIFIKGATNLAIFGNKYAAESFIESNFKGNIDLYFLSRAVQNTNARLEKEFYEKERDIDTGTRSVANMSITVAISVAVSQLVINGAKFAWNYCKEHKEQIMTSMKDGAQKTKDIVSKVKNVKDMIKH